MTSLASIILKNLSLWHNKAKRFHVISNVNNSYERYQHVETKIKDRLCGYDKKIEVEMIFDRTSLPGSIQYNTMNSLTD